MKIPFSSHITAVYQSRHEPEAAQVLARMYWAMLMVLFGIILVASVGYGAWEFSQPLDATESGVTVGTPKVILNRAELQEVLDGFDARAQKFEERRETPAVPDPS